MDAAEVKDLLNKMNALEGSEGSCKVNSVALMQDPIVANRLAVELLQKVDRDSKPELVVAAEGVDSYFGYSVALAAWMRFLCAEKEGEGFKLPKGTSIKKNEKTILVIDSYNEDTAKALIETVTAQGAKPVAILSLVGPAEEPSHDWKVLSLL